MAPTDVAALLFQEKQKATDNKPRPSMHGQPISTRIFASVLPAINFVESAAHSSTVVRAVPIRPSDSAMSSIATARRAV